MCVCVYTREMRLNNYSEIFLSVRVAAAFCKKKEAGDLQGLIINGSDRKEWDKSGKRALLFEYVN